MGALAGFIFAAGLDVATPKTGLGLELDVIAAVALEARLRHDEEARGKDQRWRDKGP
jgi:hypothetical protein